MIVLFLASMIVGMIIGQVSYYWLASRRFKRQHPELLDENGKVKPFPYRTVGEQYRNPYDW